MGKILDLTDLIQESKDVSRTRFLKVVKDVTNLLRSENGRIGNFTVTDRLVQLEPVGEALIIGDLHGDLKSLSTILKESAFIEKMKKTRQATLIFLGDYGDRGAYSVEVYFVVLSLKLAFPEQVILLRGNHEGPEDLMVSPHDLPLQFEYRFKDSSEAYLKTRKLFEYLSNAVYVSERYLMVHGGVSPKISSLKDIAQASQRHPKETTLENLLWSDPDEKIDYTAASPRCAGLHFGKKVVETVLEKVDAKILIRGHEPVEQGYRINHDGKVLTLFSMKGAPYFNEYGTYLQVDLSFKPQNAKDLTLYIHKF